MLGGGIYITTSAPKSDSFLISRNSTNVHGVAITIFDTIFQQNAVGGNVDTGGGAMVTNCSTGSSCQIKVSQCLFEYNSVSSELLLGTARGGALLVLGMNTDASVLEGNTLVLNKTILRNNFVKVYGSGQGGGSFVANGGALAFDGLSFLSFSAINCTVSNNYVVSAVTAGSIAPLGIMGGAFSITAPSESYLTIGSSTWNYDSPFAGVFISHCNFSENSVSVSAVTIFDVEVLGGAIFCTSDMLLIEASSFSGNSNQAGSGGAVACVGVQAVTTFKACHFFNNTAVSTSANRGLGGAVFVADLAFCTFEDACRFDSNQAMPLENLDISGSSPVSGAGGGLAIRNSGVVCNGCSFTSNIVVANSRTDMVEGGAVFIEITSSLTASKSQSWITMYLKKTETYFPEIKNATSLFVNSTFAGNVAGVPLNGHGSFGAGLGGAVSSQSSASAFHECTFVENEAWSNMEINAVGGAISLDQNFNSGVIQAPINVTFSTSIRHTFNIDDQITPSFTNCNFLRNTVRCTFSNGASGSVCGLGGAMYANGVRLLLSNNTWESNFISCMRQGSVESQAVGNGGALFIDSGGSVTDVMDTFIGNGMSGAKEMGMSVFLAEAVRPHAEVSTFDDCTFQGPGNFRWNPDDAVPTLAQISAETLRSRMFVNTTEFMTPSSKHTPESKSVLYSHVDDDLLTATSMSSNQKQLLQVLSSPPPISSPSEGTSGNELCSSTPVDVLVSCGSNVSFKKYISKRQPASLSWRL